MRTTCALEPEVSVKEFLDVQKTIVLERSCANFVQKTRANKLVLFGFDQFQDAFFEYLFSSSRASSVSTICGRCRFLDCKKQDLKVAQSAKVDSATVPLEHHQFELPMDGKDDLETFSMPVSPHDRDIMHRARGVM